MHRLLDNGSMWELNPKHQNAIDGLKQLTSDPLPAHFKDIPLVLLCDESPVEVAIASPNRDNQGMPQTLKTMHTLIEKHCL